MPKNACVPLTTLLILAACSTAAAQNSGEIRGRVVDAAGRTPIAGARVDLTESGRSVATAASSTDSMGGFRLRALRPARYRVSIRAIGYVARELPPVEIGSSVLDLGTVALTAAPVQLQGITTTAQQERPVDLAPDRNTYIVRNMPNTRGGTALDVLRNVPSVDVDIDNIVSLRGNSGVIVQINGRPSPMKPAQLGTFLAQLRAEMVDKVEVVTNPSARGHRLACLGAIHCFKDATTRGRSGPPTLAAAPAPLPPSSGSGFAQSTSSA